MGPFSEFWDSIFDVVNDAGGEERIAFIPVTPEFLGQLAEGEVEFSGTISVSHDRGAIWHVSFNEDR